jgi:hypothetical protein
MHLETFFASSAGYTTDLMRERNNPLQSIAQLFYITYPRVRIAKFVRIERYGRAYSRTTVSTRIHFHVITGAIDYIQYLLIGELGV